jgi:hypothetical protein
MGSIFKTIMGWIISQKYDVRMNDFGGYLEFGIRVGFVASIS